MPYLSVSLTCLKVVSDASDFLEDEEGLPFAIILFLPALIGWK